MNIILCVDDRWGMFFNGRRQSRDSVLLKDIADLCGTRKLWMSEYSGELFSRYGFSLQICDPDFLEKAGPDDFCFVEDRDPSPYREEIGEIVLYRWNRIYPADVRFDPALLDGRRIADTREFAGSSHEKITREVYL